LLRVSPSIATDLCRIEFSGQPGWQPRLRLVDAAGRVRKETRLPAQVSTHWSVPLNVANLPDGVYFIQVSSARTLLSHKLLVKHAGR